MRMSNLRIPLALTYYCSALLCYLVSFTIMKYCNSSKEKKSGIPQAGMRFVSWCDCMAVGIFLGTCFLALIPYVQASIKELMRQYDWDTSFPLPECVMISGFFFTLTIEQMFLSWHEKDGNQEEEDPLLPCHIDYNKFADCKPTTDSSIDKKGSDLRYCLLILAALTHTFFEGLAIGLQKDDIKAVHLFIGVMVHENLIYVALGIKSASMGSVIFTKFKYAFLLPLSIPVAIVVGGLIRSSEDVRANILSAGLQGIAAGVFLHVVFLDLLPCTLATSTDRMLKLLFLFLGFLLMANVTLVLSFLF